MHVFSVVDEAEFDANKHVEKILGTIEAGDVTVACWEPGQISPYHCHPHATEIYFCFEGGGTMRTPGETIAVVPGAFVVHPPGEVHEYANGPQRTLLFRVRYGSDMAARHLDWRGRQGWKQSAQDAEYYRHHPANNLAARRTDVQETALSRDRYRRALLGRRACEDLYRRRGRPAGRAVEAAADLGALRIKEMDEAGIDIQVLSHGAPSTQKLPAETAAAFTARVNDRLHAAVAGNPSASPPLPRLPTAVPEAAADELERTAKLGFKGAMLHGLANGIFLDDKRFWPIYARAEKLDVPIYLHPSLPNADVMRIYYDDYVKDFPTVARPAWGYTVETATLAIRLVLSGVFERHPKLKIILGHLGETLPFLVWRVDHALNAAGAEVDELPRHFLQQFLCHDQRQFLQSGAAVLRDGDGHRPYPVRRRLAVCDESAGDQMDGRRAALRRRQGQDSQRQRQAAVEDVNHDEQSAITVHRATVKTPACSGPAHAAASSISSVTWAANTWAAKTSALSGS